MNIMTHTEKTLRRAEHHDAALLRHCFELASDGMAPYFWEQSRKPHETLDMVASARMRGKIADPKNDVWIAGAGEGAVLSYQLGDTPEPLDGLPDFIKPVVALENRVLGTRYVNILAVVPEHQRKGRGRTLLERVQSDAEGGPLSLIVSDENAGARALYEDFGFRETYAETQVNGGWSSDGDTWILMVKDA